MVSGLLYLESRDEPRRIVGVGCYMMIQYPYLAIHWLQSSFQGRFCFDFCPFFCKFVHFKLTITISRKNATSCFHFKVMLSLPGYFRLFPAYFRPFPGISTQKNRHISTQSRAKSAQKVRNSKLTTVVKK